MKPPDSHGRASKKLHHSFAVLDHHHAVVAHGCGVDLVEALGGGVHGGVEAEGAFATLEVIVDGLWHADAVDAALHQVCGSGHGAVTTDAHQGVELVRAHGVDPPVGEVAPLGLPASLDGEALRIGLIAGAQNGANPHRFAI